MKEEIEEGTGDMTQEEVGEGMNQGIGEGMIAIEAGEILVLKVMIEENTESITDQEIEKTQALLITNEEVKVLTKITKKWLEEKDPTKILINLNEDQADIDPTMIGTMTETDTDHLIVKTDMITQTDTDHLIVTTDIMIETDQEVTEIEKMINTLPVIINMKAMTENQNMKKIIKK